MANKKNYEMSRRSFIKGALGLLGGLLVRDSFLPEDNETLANILLKGLPFEIPGAASVEKHFTPDASQCLTHVKQMHYVEGMPAVLVRPVMDVQKDIHQILSYLIDHQGLEKVYSEGVIESWEDFHSAVREVGELVGTDPAIRNHPKFKGIEKVERNYRIREGLSAARQLSKQGRLQLLPAETIAGNGMASLINNEYIKMGRREDIALELIAKANDPFSVVVYGGGHDFKDNVEKWNSKNPERKFSLAVITPQAFVKYQS